MADTTAAYQAVEQDIVETRLRWVPGGATGLGRHDYDAELGDRSDEAFEGRLQELRDQIARMEAIEPAALPEPYRTRHPILLRKLRYEHDDEAVYADSHHSPGLGLALVGGSCLALINRDFAPLPERARSLAGRLRGARRLLVQLRGRHESCSPIHARTAIQQGAGTLSLLEHDLPKAMEPLQDAAVKAEVQQALQDALDAVHMHLRWLREEVQPAATAPIAWGRPRMEALLRQQEYVETEIETLVQRGEEDLRRHQARLRELAAQIDPGVEPAEVVRRVAAEHPTAAELLPWTEQTLEELRQFCVDRDLITMPTEVRIRLQETPPFSRATTLAACSTPGQWEQVATEAFYYVTPPDAAWDAERSEQYLQFFNRYAMPLVTAHEAYPGHYVHLSWLRLLPDALPYSFTNSITTIEGYAHYTEKLMIEAGWGGGDPRVEIMQMREALLRLCRYLAAFGMHTGGWSYDDAVAFFMREGYSTRPVAELESARGVIGPSYFAYTLGKHEILALREALRAKWGSGFTLKRFHDAFVKEPYPTAVIAARLLAGDGA